VEDTVVLILLVAFGVLLVLGVLGKVLELRLRRDGESVAVRGVMSDALRCDPGPLGLAVTIVRIRVPLWTGSPVTVRLAGEVPSDQLREALLQSVRRAAKSNLVVRVRIKSRIRVRPTAPSSKLRTARSG
jgi:hypothetical protein